MEDDVESNFTNREFIDFQPRTESFPLYLDEGSDIELLDQPDGG